MKHGELNTRPYGNLQWEVQSEKNPDDWYLVDIEGTPTCTCWDFRKKSAKETGFECKHIIRGAYPAFARQMLKHIKEQTPF